MSVPPAVQVHAPARDRSSREPVAPAGPPGRQPAETPYAAEPRARRRPRHPGLPQPHRPGAVVLLVLGALIVSYAQSLRI